MEGKAELVKRRKKVEGSQQTQLIVADKEAVKRSKKMEGKEKEVVQRMKIMEGEEGSQVDNKDDHLLRLCETLITNTVLHRTRNASWYAFIEEEVKRQIDKLIMDVEKLFGRP